MTVDEMTIEAHAIDVVELQARVLDLEAERDLYREMVQALLDLHHKLQKDYRALRAQMDFWLARKDRR